MKPVTLTLMGESRAGRATDPVRSNHPTHCLIRSGKPWASRARRSPATTGPAALYGHHGREGGPFLQDPHRRM